MLVNILEIFAKEMEKNIYILINEMEKQGIPYDKILDAILEELEKY